MVQGVHPQMICLKGHAAPNKAIDGDSASYFAGDHDVGVLTVKFWLGIKLFLCMKLIWMTLIAQTVMMGSFS
jgi:hypothetical protein